MTDTEEKTMRANMLKIDKLIHTVDNESLQYMVHKAGCELEIRSQEYMADCYDKIRVKIPRKEIS